MTPGRSPRPRGFTLVELMLAILALGVGLTAIAPLYVQATKRAAASADIGDIGALAVRRMELLRQRSFGTLTAGGSLTTNTTGYFDTGDPDVTVRWTIVNNSSRMKTITVRASTNRPINGAVKMAEFSTRRVP